MSIKFQASKHLRQYTRQYSLYSMSLLLISVAINAILIFALGALLFMQAPTRYFATNAAGGVTPMIPTTESYLKDNQVLVFASLAALSSTSFDFVNYQRELNQAGEFFTQAGFASFEEALRDTGGLEQVIQEKNSTFGFLVGKPVIINQGIVNGTYTWQVEIPLGVEVDNANDTITNRRYSLKMDIIRVPTNENLKGIAVSRYTLRFLGTRGGPVR